MYLKIMWRYMIMLGITLPLMITDCMQSVQDFFSLMCNEIASVLILSLLHMAYVCLMYYSAENTFVMHTLVLSSTSIMFVALWKAVRRDPFTRLELIGIVVNVIGIYLCYCEYHILDCTFAD